jgi:hypothetical protein
VKRCSDRRDFQTLFRDRSPGAFYRRRVPPQLRRFLPLILIAFLALIVLPRLFHRHTSGLSDSQKATRTADAMNLIETGEQSFKAAHGRFTSHLADLLVTKSKLADDLAIGLGVQLDVSTDGRSFYAQITGDVLSLVRARTGPRLTAESCLILKSGSGVHCPTPGQ